MTKFFSRSGLGTVLMLVFLFNAQASITLSDPVPVGPQVLVGKLDNGLSYYIQQNGKPANKLELRLVIKAGSIHEADDQQGLAHLTEHMAFNGSTHFKKQELVSYLQSIGVKFGADLNAYTSFDETVYILPIPTDKPENIDKGFLVLQDWAGGLTLDRAEVDQERGIVLEELRLRKGAGERMRKVLLPKIYNGSKYAERLPIGKEDVIKTFKHEALERFYKDWYRPELMAVVVVGDIDPKDAERRIKAHFSDLRNPKNAPAHSYPPIPLRAETEALVITDKEANGNELLIRYPVTEIVPDATLGAYRTSLIKQMFAGMLNQRLQELAQRADPPFLRGSSAIGRLTKRYESYNVSAALGKGGAAPAIEALLLENARARHFGFGPAELERAKKNLLRFYERAHKERDKTDSARYAAEYLRHFLQQEPIPGIEAEYVYVREFLPSITLAELNAYARATIPSDAAKLVVYMGSGKASSPAPTRAALLASVAAAEQLPVSPNEEQAVAGALMEQPPKAGAVIAESHDKELGLTRLTLSNGVKVILKPTDFSNDQVVMSALRFGGQSLFEDADLINARYANAVVSSMGIGVHAPLELQKVLAGKSASVGVALGKYAELISGNASSSDIDTMLQLVHLKFTDARQDDTLFQSFIARQREQARNALAQPEVVFGDTIAATLYGGHPRVTRVMRPEDFAGITRQRSAEIYQQRFSSAKDLTFVLVGSFDIAAIKPLLTTYLASLPTPDIPVRYQDRGVRPVTGVIKKEVFSGTEAKSTISINFTGSAAYSEAERLRFHAMLEIINLRITEVLREKMALIYGGGMSGDLTPFPYPHYNIKVGLPTGPDKVERAIAATFAEIDKLKTEGPSVEDLNKVKQTWLQSHQRALRENSYWLGQIQNALMHGSDPAEILQYSKQVNAITPAELKNAASRYFKMDNYVQVILSPEN